jgi:hypothetical protein
VAVGVIALVAIGYFMWRQRKLTLNLREQVQLLAGRGNEVPKDPRLEYSGVPPYHDHERYELGRFRGETAELPVENGRMSGR